MTKKTKRKRKHIPQRTCVGCRTVQSKRGLIRIVRTTEGVQVDPSGKLAGRGAYLHENLACWENGLKGALANALRVTFTAADRERLTTFMTTLTESDNPVPGEQNE